MKKRHEATVARKIMSKKIMLITLCSMLIAVVPPVEAQQAGNVHRIGFLSGTSLHAPTTDGFRQGLRDLGHIEGKNILVEYRFDVNPERFPSHVAELVELKVDVLATGNLAAIRAAKQATKTIPIVMVTTVDPVATGLVDSLAHPGGNITGLTRLTRELSGKRLELLREVVPRMSRVGVLWDADDPGAVNGFKEYDTAARALKIPIQSSQVRSSNPDFEQAFRDATKGRTSAHWSRSGVPCSYVTQSKLRSLP
jgi:putative tryptophan/tyrosine transport system substrate-binding protein